MARCYAIRIHQKLAGLLLALCFASAAASGSVGSGAGAPSADLSVQLSAFPRPVPFDRPFELSIEVRNRSDSTVVDAFVSVAVPGGNFGTFTAPFGWTCAVTSMAFECRNPAFTSATSYINVRVAHTQPVGSSIASRAQISSTVPDPDESNNVSSISTLVSGAYADLYLELEGGRGQVRPGTDITYRLFVFNSGPSSAAAAFVDVPLDPGTTFVSFEMTGGSGPPWTCTSPAVGESGTIRCELAVLPHARGAFFTFVARARAGTVGTVLRTTASIGSATPDPKLADNSATAVSLVQSGSEIADLALTINDSPDPVLPSGTISYTITLTNNGPDTAVSGFLEIFFPEADDIVVNTPADWNCQFMVPPPVWPPPPGIMFCERRIFPVEVSVFSFVLRPQPDAIGPLVLSAEARSATTDPDLSNNSATATTRTIFGAAVGVPALSPALLALLAVVLALVGMRAAARRA